jgi:hypothetical protein
VLEQEGAHADVLGARAGKEDGKLRLPCPPGSRNRNSGRRGMSPAVRRHGQTPWLVFARSEVGFGTPHWRRWHGRRRHPEQGQVHGRVDALAVAPAVDGVQRQLLEGRQRPAVGERGRHGCSGLLDRGHERPMQVLEHGLAGQRGGQGGLSQ